MPRTILVVDDEPDCCEALRDFFAEMGYGVVETYTGDEALEAYWHERPILVLLDMMMPGMSGLVTLRELKAIDPKARVIMCSALHEEELAKQAMAEGALDYITKPINLDYLERAVATTITPTGTEG
ncbi:MAG: response regulator [Nitrospinota bacterium]